ncbi:hypothetical protein GQX73_g5787 [Xylaria multiplex]|uniref:Nephrocystin 3-like N-terminal domain-containing protein n=1 Tax=Xylaria multiplex TaxID=323545 RepID=A0A7C8IS74_9PEZI|nr:hypothetical protein GQX73_g5787 [Xylaria multiplex]
MDPINTGAVTDGHEPERAHKLSNQEVNDVHQHISTWLISQLDSVGLSIQKLESIKASPEFSQELNSVRKMMMQQGDKLLSLLKSIYTDEQPADWYRDVIHELDSLAKLLTAFTLRLAPIQSPSDLHLSDQGSAFPRIRPFILHSSEFRGAMAEARNNFIALATSLEPLQESIKLAAVVQRARLVEKESLERKFESIEKKLALYGAAQDSTHVPLKEAQSKMRLEISVNARGMYPRIDQRYNPFRDSPSSNKARHEHFHKEWLGSTCNWFVSSDQFWDQWLFGDSLAPQIFYCWGPSGVGKSIITSHVIHRLNDLAEVCAYYYLGEGHVQSAVGLVMGLLGQLCDLNLTLQTLNDTIEYHITDSAGPEKVDEVATSITGGETPQSCPNARLGSEIYSLHVTKQPAEEGSPLKELVDGPKMSLRQPNDPLPTLLNALSEVCSKISSPVFILLDAWDEGNMENLDDFRRVLNTLISSKCKVFLTGREQPDNSTTLVRPYTELEVGQPSNFDDIQRSVESRLGAMKDIEIQASPRGYEDRNYRPEPDVSELASTIVRFSHGMLV